MSADRFVNNEKGFNLIRIDLIKTIQWNLNYFNPIEKGITRYKIFSG